MRYVDVLADSARDADDVARLAVSNLRRSPKYADHGVVRVVPPEDTIERVLPLCDQIGVTRVSDVTGLDRTGIPNFMTVRPREVGNGISYYNGKGITPAAAKAGALMEAVERHSGETCALPVLVGTRAEIECRGATVDPRALIEPYASPYHEELALEWVEGYDLLADRPTYVPLNCVVCPYIPGPGAAQIYYSHTSGLASGNTLEEAVCHAICEITERDAISMVDTVDAMAGVVRQVYLGSKIGGSLPTDWEPLPRGPRIDLETLPASSRALVERMHDAGLLVYLRDVSEPNGIATLDCICIEPQLNGRHLGHGGSGAHPDARVAVNRALTEAAQSRVAHIQGGREDFTHIVREPVAFDPHELVSRGEGRPFDMVPTVENRFIDDDVRYLLDRLSAAGFDHVVAVDLTRPELGVPVVRVMIPDAETWSVFFQHGARARLGRRANRLLSDTMREWMTT